MNTPPAHRQPVEDARTAAAWEAAREGMVRDQLIGGGRDIRDPAVLRAMGSVPRHRFVPPGSRSEAYDDHPVPIGLGQTISQPYIVALMVELLSPSPSQRVLEIGTGSGYQTAILAELVREVFSVEILEPLARTANEVLTALGYANIHLAVADGHAGWPAAAPFEGIVVSCAAPTIPASLTGQLAEGGRMVIPVGASEHQDLLLLERHGNRLFRQTMIPVRFVPMTGLPVPP